jgi:hypothetical protein
LGLISSACRLCRASCHDQLQFTLHITSEVINDIRSSSDDHAEVHDAKNVWIRIVDRRNAFALWYDRSHRAVFHANQLDSTCRRSPPVSPAAEFASSGDGSHDLSWGSILLDDPGASEKR